MEVKPEMRQFLMDSLDLPEVWQFLVDSLCDAKKPCVEDRSKSKAAPAAAQVAAGGPAAGGPAAGGPCVPDILEKLCDAIDEASQRMIHVVAAIYTPADLKLGITKLEERLKVLALAQKSWTIRCLLHANIKADFHPVSTKERTNEQDTRGIA
jgi:hypothetical protein